MRFVVLRLAERINDMSRWSIHVYYGNTLVFCTFPNTRAYTDVLAEKILGEVG